MSIAPQLDAIQANILYGSRQWQHAIYAFFEITNPNKAAPFFASISRHALSAAQQEKASKAREAHGTPMPPNLNIAFTHGGLLAMRSAFADSDRFSGGRFFVLRNPHASESDDPRPLSETSAANGRTAFEAGMHASATVLRDGWPTLKDGAYFWPDGTAAHAWWAGDDDPDPWSYPLTSPHLLLWISARSKSEAAGLLEALCTEAQASGGMTCLGSQTARALPDGREHFGFVDGISNPAIEQVRPGAPGDGKLGARGWEGVKAGEFFLGYPNESGPTDPRIDFDPELPDMDVMKDGTFLVYRKLEQDVEGFRAVAQQLAGPDATPAQVNTVAARMMGRRHDGDPLTRYQPLDGRNSLLYEHDPKGFGTPRQSHVRLSHPRDDQLFQGRRANAHRLIRRGLPYGSPYDSGNPNRERGLIFIAFNARIEDQFEFVQSRWLNGKDPISGSTFNADTGEIEDLHLVLNGEPPLFAKVKPFSAFRGGDYFFVPSLRGLDAIIQRSKTVGPELPPQVGPYPS